MKTVTTREAQHHLSKVLEAVEAGEEVVITRRGKKVAKLSPFIGSAPGSDKVNWGEVLEGMDNSLDHLPKLKGSSVELLRELDRY